MKKSDGKDAFMTGINSITKKEPRKEIMPEIARHSSAMLKEENKETIKKPYPAIYDKILPPQIDDSYYDDCPLTPGVNFMKKLFSDDDTMRYIKNLKINIPETFWEMYYVCNDPQKNNEITVHFIKRDFLFYDIIKEIEEKQYKRKFNLSDPYAIVLNQDTPRKNSHKVERYETAAKNLKETGDGLMQRYIRSRGRNRDLIVSSHKEIPLVRQKDSNITINQLNDKSIPDFGGGESAIAPIEPYKFFSIPAREPKQNITKPSIIRLRCKTRYNESKIPNIAYYIINKKPLEVVLKETSKEHAKQIVEKYNQLTTVNLEDKSTYEIFIMSGESLRPYEYYANQIIDYVQKYFKLFLKDITIDFIRDERGIIYFLGVRAFTKLFHKKEDYLRNISLTKDYLNNEANVKKIYKTLTCRLCTLPYPKSKITKMVTFKLLMRLKENLSKRGFNIFEHLINNNYNEQQTCSVCDLCYKLLVTEQELLEIQKTIALCMNIQVPSEEEIKKKNTNPETLNRFYKKIDSCNQWRALFYFTRLYNIELDKLPFEEGINYKLYIKLFDQKIGIPIFTKNTKVINTDEVELNLAKMFYFFSDENSNVKQILKNEVVDFRIVINDEWHNPLAQCQSTTFSSFDLENKNVRIKTTLNFFSPEIRFFKCQVYIGLAVNYNIISKNIPLYSFKLLNTIYLTDEDYFSHHELPDDWFELFLPSDAEINDDISNDFETSIDKLIKEDAFRDINKKNKMKRRKKQTDKDDDVLYDPYNVLVQLQQKKNMINKIKSIPILHDRFARGKSAANSRPNTAFQKSLSKIASPNNQIPIDHRKDSNDNISSEGEFVEAYKKEAIMQMDHDNLEKLLNKMDKKMSNFNI